QAGFVGSEYPYRSGRFPRHRSLDRGPVNSTLIFSASLGFAVSHSQTTSVRNPIERKALIFAASRLLFASNLAVQNDRFRFGTVALTQWRWWCQKQPLTKIAHRPFLFAKSGEPGKDLTLRRYPNFSCRSKRATSSSALVFRCRTRRMSSERAESIGAAYGLAFIRQRPRSVRER